MGRHRYAGLISQVEPVLRAISDGITIQDAEGNVLYANDAAARTLGFLDAKTMLLVPPRDLYARYETFDESGALVDAQRLPGRIAIAGGEAQPLLARIRDRATGRTWWVELRADAIRDENGVPVLAINIWHDATERQRQRESSRYLADATRELAASLDYETTLANVAKTLVPELADWVLVELDVQGVRTQAVAHVDPAKVTFAEQLIRRYPPALQARTGSPHVFRTGKSELLAEVTREYLSSIARNAEHLELLLEVGMRSGMAVPIMVNGRAEGVLTLITAESGRRYDERDVELAEEIGRRAGTAIEHARLYRSAKNAVRAREEFLAVAGHELRTPLAALVLNLESLESALDSGAFERDPARYRPRVARAVGHTHRLARLIDELLDVSRVAGGDIRLRRDAADLTVIIRGVFDDFKGDAARTGSHFQIGLDSPCEGLFDSARIQQLVSNLVENAVKYGAGRPIEVTCTTEGDHAVMRVIDHGIGIPEADRARVFLRFERAVSERNYSGLGLGLWIAQRVVDAHGGTIELMGTAGGGSTFEVRLPLTPSP